MHSIPRVSDEARRRTLELAAGRFEYLEQGAGEPVVLLHGSGSSCGQWRGLAGELAPRYLVLAPDLYGYGASPNWTGGGAFALAHEAEIVRALLARVTGPVHLVGHSYGGAVALHLARSLGDRLRSLTLIEPAAFHLLHEAEPQMAKEIARVAESMIQAEASGNYLDGYGRFIDYWNGRDTWAQIPAEKRDAMSKRLPKVVLDFEAAFNEPARLRNCQSVAAPTLVMYGTHSPRPTQRICELLAQAIPAARLKIVPDVGHMAPVTHPERINPAIVDQVDANGRFSVGRRDTNPAGAAGKAA